MTGRAQKDVPRKTTKSQERTTAGTGSESVARDEASAQGPRSQPDSAAERSPGPRSQPDSAAESSAEDVSRRDEQVETGPPEGERLVEEELPPGFWEEAQVPHPPSPRQRQQVLVDPDRSPRDQVSAAPDSGAVVSSSATSTLNDPAFATLQALFPGQILSIEADEAEAAEEAVEAVADQVNGIEPEDEGE